MPHLLWSGQGCCPWRGAESWNYACCRRHTGVMQAGGQGSGHEWVPVLRLMIHSGQHRESPYLDDPGLADLALCLATT